MPRSAATPLLTPRNLVLCGMIVFTVIYRVAVHYAAGALPWNFTPVEAIALFGGVYFADKRLALIVPLIALFVADLVIGFYGVMMPVVYGCVALTAFAGFSLRCHARASNVMIAALASATGFYLVTNFFVWATSAMYPHTFDGLIACYVAGWPFYQYGTLPGTLLWSAALFGGFALLSQRYAALQPIAA